MEEPAPITVTPLESFPPQDRWDDWVEYDPKAWPKKVERHYALVPTTCFNCEAACGLMAYVDKEDLSIRKLEGNPHHPGSRGRNCAKGPATLNQIQDPERILFPLKRVGPRGSGKFEPCSWQEVIEVFSTKIRNALTAGRKTEVMYHVGRPGHDGYMDRVLQSWGVDGHNSHTNVCSAAARLGYATTMGADRPSPDHENAKFMLLLSSHLETGHYFNPHAQRIIDGKMKGAKIAVIDVRLSNTASVGDYWLAPHPGTEAFLLLSRLRARAARGRSHRPRLPAAVDELARVPRGQSPGQGADVRRVHRCAEGGVRRVHARCRGIRMRRADAARSSRWRARSAPRAARSHRTSGATPRPATKAAGRSRAACSSCRRAGRRRRREGRHRTGTGTTSSSGAVPASRAAGRVERTALSAEWPLSHHELSFLLPHFCSKSGRGKLDAYFTRVYNPVWTNPDGMLWEQVLRDESLVGCTPR
jgi:hypothetical protein